MYNSNFNLDSFSYYEKLEELRKLKLDKILSNAFQTEIKREQQKPTVNVGTVGYVTMPSLTTLARSIKEINNEKEISYP